MSQSKPEVRVQELHLTLPPAPKPMAVYKPAVRVGGLSVLQWACLAVLAYYAPHVPRLVTEVRRG